MDESVFAKEPIYQFEAKEMVFKEIYIGPAYLGGVRASNGAPMVIGEYTVYTEGNSELTIPIPVSKCMLDARKRYALRISVFEVD